MKEFVKPFSTFVFESARYGTSAPELGSRLSYIFDNFTFEEDIPALIDDVERGWSGLCQTYWWNRESQQFRKNHFALNVKVYVWPDLDKFREIAKDPDADEDEMFKYWYRWMSDQQDVLLEEVKDKYDWVKEVGFGGKSGGWLLLAVDAGKDDVEETIESLCMDYKDLKDKYRETGELDDLMDLDRDSDITQLTSLNLHAENADLAGLKSNVKDIRDGLNSMLSEVNAVDSNMKEILAYVERFREHAKEWFYEYLKYEFDDSTQ